MIGNYVEEARCIAFRMSFFSPLTVVLVTLASEKLILAIDYNNDLEMPYARWTNGLPANLVLFVSSTSRISRDSRCGRIHGQLLVAVAFGNLLSSSSLWSRETSGNDASERMREQAMTIRHKVSTLVLPYFPR